VDDAHHFQREFTKARANPGRGWVVVWTQFVDANGHRLDSAGMRPTRGTRRTCFPPTGSTAIGSGE
jgi:hypothetical protein